MVAACGSDIISGGETKLVDVEAEIADGCSPPVVGSSPVVGIASEDAVEPPTAGTVGPTGIALGCAVEPKDWSPICICLFEACIVGFDAIFELEHGVCW